MFKIMRKTKQKQVSRQKIRYELNQIINNFMSEINYEYIFSCNFNIYNGISAFTISEDRIKFNAKDKKVHIVQNDHKDKFIMNYDKLRNLLIKYYDLDKSVLENPVLIYTFVDNKSNIIKIVLIENFVADADSNLIRILIKWYFMSYIKHSIKKEKSIIEE